MWVPHMFLPSPIAQKQPGLRLLMCQLPLPPHNSFSSMLAPSTCSPRARAAVLAYSLWAAPSAELRVVGIKAQNSPTGSLGVMVTVSHSCFLFFVFIFFILLVLFLFLFLFLF